MSKKKKKNKQQKILRISLYLLIVFIFTCLMMFIYIGMIIGQGVKKQCDYAKERYQKTCVESLTLLLEDDNNTFKQRNSAIWALGQIGDKSALPILQKYYKGYTLGRESLDRMLSQYELSKAIGLLEGKINLTAFIWR